VKGFGCGFVARWLNLLVFLGVLGFVWALCGGYCLGFTAKSKGPRLGAFDA
jgi:hypothetical protein